MDLKKHAFQERIKEDIESREYEGMSVDVGPDELVFDSKFESGNLDVVVKTGERSYDMFMRPDSNTCGHLHWFYFSVRNARKGHTVKFSIMNFTKRLRLYQQGMRPNVWSAKRHEHSLVGWHRAGENVTYGRSKVCGNRYSQVS